jgi:hypothetical protein
MDAKALKNTIKGYYAPIKDPVAYWETVLGQEKAAKKPTPRRPKKRDGQGRTTG